MYVCPLSTMRTRPKSLITNLHPTAWKQAGGWSTSMTLSSQVVGSDLHTMVNNNPTHSSSPHPISFREIAHSSLTDITYQSLAKSFNQPLQYHDETVHRLTEMTKHRPWVQQQNEEQRTATKRMALLPNGGDVEALFVGEDTWVVSTIPRYL